MVKLSIKVESDSGGNPEIVVRDKDGNGKKKNPDVEVDPWGQTRWKAKEPGEVFRVFFFTDSTRTTVFWPFGTTGPKAVPPDGNEGPDRPYLEVVHDPKKERWLHVSGPWSLKYDVKAMNPANVPQLDPVIIIKPPTSYLSFGMLCALAGAAAGAVMGALLALRLWQ